MNSAHTPADDARVRALAEAMDCFTVDDIIALYGITEGTAETWRKRGKGPRHIMAGTRPLYPRANVKADLEGRQRPRNTDGSPKDRL